MLIYTISIKSNKSLICDTIQLGMIIYDSDAYPHVLISYEKLSRIKSLLSESKYVNVKFALDTFLSDLKEENITYDKIEDYFNYFDILDLNKINWLTHIKDDMLQEKYEIYEMLFKEYIYKNIRADKIRQILD